jgi:hypothetical protein
MDAMYPTITQQDEQDILTRFLTWILDVDDSETFILVTENALSTNKGLHSRLVEMTNEQEIKILIQKYFDWVEDQGASH